MKYSQTLKNLFLFNCDLSQNGKGRLMKMQKRIVTIHNINKRKKERKKLYYIIVYLIDSVRVFRNVILMKQDSYVLIGIDTAKKNQVVPTVIERV